MKKIYYKFRDVPPFLLWGLTLYLSLKMAGKAYILLSLIFVLLSVTLRVWSRIYIGEHTRGRDLDAPSLVSAGPYSISRNPLYISNMIFGIAVVLIYPVQWYVKILILFLFTVHYYVLGVIESHYVRGKFNSEYDEWAKKTPLWIGVFTYVKGKSAYKITAAIINDRWTWFFQSAMLLISFIIDSFY
jgi:protein-S-isoprenylcysteine O-methyltransferase Ste14